MQVITNGLLTSYSVAGSGEVVLVLHGWADSSASFQPFAASLGKHFQLVLLDLPGFGGTQAPESAWGLAEYAEFVAAFVRKAKLDVYGVIGHSNGGAITIYSVAHGLLQPQKVVLLASAGLRNHGSGKKQLLKMVAKAGKLAAKPLPGLLQRRLRQKLYTAAGSDMLVAEHLQETFKRVVSYDVLQDAQKVDVPVLLIYGEQDPDTPVWMGERLHQALRSSTLEVLPGAGHFVHVDRANDVEKAIMDYLK